MVDATDVKGRPTASSLNKGVGASRVVGGARGGMTSKRPVVCDRRGRPGRPTPGTMNSTPTPANPGSLPAVPPELREWLTTLLQAAVILAGVGLT